MSKSLPPKINLREGKREEGGRNGRGGDGGGGRETALQRGPKGKESPFQWNKNCAISTRSARRLWKCPRVQGTRVHPPPSFSSQTVSSDSGTIRASIWRPDVHRDAREPVMSGSVMPCPSANTSHIFPGLRPVCVDGIDGRLRPKPLLLNGGFFLLFLLIFFEGGKRCFFSGGAASSVE